MNIKRLLPDTETAMGKYGRLIKRKDAAEAIQKNRHFTAQVYLILGFLFLLSFGTILCRSFNGNADGLDLTAIVLLYVTLIVLVYKKRYSRIEKQVQRMKESIVEDFPEFIDKLILLLNAGMVTEAAIRKISSDYEKFHGAVGRRALYEGVSDIIDRIHETNSTLQRELSEYAVKSGVRELLRFSAIVEDNLNKGSGLAEKLEEEGALLWMGRKKRAEAKARLAETKLSLPLMLLLLSLMLITTAPMLLSI